MNSQERREARYQRRKNKRAENLRKRNEVIGRIEEVFSFSKMYRYGKECCKGVRWKQSTQNFEAGLISGTAERREAVLTGKWKQKKLNSFTLLERGKKRQIDAPHINDRQIHKTFTKEVLVPLYSAQMIRDNGASQKGKGLHWQYGRIAEQLRSHYRKYECEGGVFLLDLKGFFPNAPKELIYAQHRRYILDPKLRAIGDYIVKASQERGMPLGIEPSQQEMVMLPNPVDQWIKCQLGLKFAGHYMDDYYIIYPDIEALKEIGEKVIQAFEERGIAVNREKCRIIPLSRPFKFCKARFRLTESGKVVINRSPEALRRIRQKIKYFVKAGVSGEEVSAYLKMAEGYYRKYQDHGKVLAIREMAERYKSEEKKKPPFKRTDYLSSLSKAAFSSARDE